jgi:hypothetical protein
MDMSVGALSSPYQFGSCLSIHAVRLRVDLGLAFGICAGLGGLDLLLGRFACGSGVGVYSSIGSRRSNSRTGDSVVAIFHELASLVGETVRLGQIVELATAV